MSRDSRMVGGALALMVVVGSPVQSETEDELYDNDRYRLVLTLPQRSAVVGQDISTTLCLSPALEEEIEVCLGGHQGHELVGGDRSSLSFNLQPLSWWRPHDRRHCWCWRPVVLTRDLPVCWERSVEIQDLGGPTVEVSGFATVLEDTHRVGRTRPSCVRVSSNAVRLTVERESGDRP